MASKLFSPIALREVELPNRIVVSPMCQYTAVEGIANDWHVMNLGQFAISGAGLIFIEATAVEAEGRITPGCVGLYNHETEAAIARVMAFCKTHGLGKMGMQLAHAGRKASADVPWRGGHALKPDQGAWQTVGASALAFGPDWHTPEALGDNSLERVKQAFVDATARTLRLGFDVLELHAAHGYLLHQFLSPTSNQRADQYGGSDENRMRFPLEVFDAVRAAWPERLPLGVRVSATDWIDGSWDLEHTIAFAKELKTRGCDYIDVSSGGLAPQQQIQSAPGYQTRFASEVKRATGLATISVGRITDPHQAETILVTEQADMVALARGILYEPRWPWHAAIALGDEPTFPPQYARSHPRMR